MWVEKFFEVGGACPWIHWWVRRETFYSVMVETRSQWTERVVWMGVRGWMGMGVMCSCLRTLIRI